MEALGDVDSSALEAMGLAQHALHQFTSGLAALRRGGKSDLAEAKALLSQCLKSAHGALCSQELVTQVLAAQAPLLLADGDMHHFGQMVSSTYMLSKMCGDIAGELAGMTFLPQVPDPLVKHADIGVQSQRKRAKMEKAIQAARESAAHKAVEALQ